MALSIKDAKRGDYVQYVGYADFQDTNSFTVGEYYQLRADYKDKCYPKAPWAHIDSGYLAFELDNCGSTTNGWGAGLFKLVATKPGNQAKIGSTVIPRTAPAKSFIVSHAPQIKPTQKEITMPTTIQQILSRLFGLEKPTTDYENRAAYIVVAYNRDGSEMGTATAASLKIIKDKVAATPELWGCKVLAYKLEKEVSVTVPVKATDITVHVPVAEEPAEK